jgi:hypothetical protein
LAVLTGFHSGKQPVGLDGQMPEGIRLIANAPGRGVGCLSVEISTKPAGFIFEII